MCIGITGYTYHEIYIGVFIGYFFQKLKLAICDPVQYKMKFPILIYFINIEKKF